MSPSGNTSSTVSRPVGGAGRVVAQETADADLGSEHGEQLVHCGGAARDPYGTTAGRIHGGEAGTGSADRPRCAPSGWAQ
jgi:hypothetical protein